MLICLLQMPFTGLTKRELQRAIKYKKPTFDGGLHEPRTHDLIGQVSWGFFSSQESIPMSNNQIYAILKKYNTMFFMVSKIRQIQDSIIYSFIVNYFRFSRINYK